MDIDIDIDAVDHYLSTARSVRRKIDFERPISRKDLEACVNVAVQAPTGIPGETWRFLIVDDGETKQRVAAVYRDVITELMTERGLPMKQTQQALMDRLPEMPCMVFVCSLGQPMPTHAGQVAFFGSVLPAAWSLMLAMRVRGIGATWTSVLSARCEQIAEILNIPDDVTQTVMLPCGYTKDATLKPADRLSAADVTYWNSWGNQTSRAKD